jgi:probable FeS assembly SUF system protein SufT
MYDEVTFQRDARAILVPDGIETTVTEGTLGFITQVLGGNFTVQLMNGYLARVDARDADALGREVPAAPAPVMDETGNIVVEDERVWDQLRTCYDPEIPVNIVELGLIYGCEIERLEGDQGGYKVDIQMTLTAPGCGMGEVLRNDVEHSVLAIPGVRETNIDLVFDPPWGPDRMSEAARLELGMD